MHCLFVGLGNPGKKYVKTRHNIGFMVLNTIAEELNWVFKEKKYCHAWVAKGEFQKKAIHLLMPSTFMNESGQAVRRYMDEVSLEPHNLMVVVDDTALPYGELRLRSKGSSGGHNGLKSIEACLGTQNYARLRMGIGHQGPRNLADYVLEDFTIDEQKTLPDFVQRGTLAIKLLVDQNITHVMKTVNTKI